MKQESPLSPLCLSVLDLSPVSSGVPAAQALHNTLDLARLADRLGYTRYWLSEHHNTAFTASPAPELLIGPIASVTERIRVGSGGIMLPNHASLKVAETFRVLEALHPGRIDLGLGRAPGTDGMTALALRRSREALGYDSFPEQLDELRGFFAGEFPEEHPFRRVRAIPDDVSAPEIFLLGSSDFSARVAAEKGLGFAFAHHINPGPAQPVLRLYREAFHPSDTLPTPQSLVAVAAVCAPTDDEADRLARSYDLAILRLHQGRMGPLPTVEEATAYPYTPEEREAVCALRHERLFWGSPETLHRQLTRFADGAGVGEIMVTTMIHDHDLRRRSYELLADAFALTKV